MENARLHTIQHWRNALQRADSIAAVEGVIRKYVGAIGPEVLSLLPAECQRAVRDQDIAAAAVTLLHSELTYQGSGDIAQLLLEMAHTYAVASNRLARVTKSESLP